MAWPQAVDVLAFAAGLAFVPHAVARGGGDFWHPNSTVWRSPAFLGLDTFLPYAQGRKEFIGEKVWSDFLYAYHGWALLEKASMAPQRGFMAPELQDDLLQEFITLAHEVPDAAAAAGTIYLVRSTLTQAYSDAYRKDVLVRAMRMLQRAKDRSHTVAASNLALILYNQGEAERANDYLSRIACRRHMSTFNNMCKYHMKYNRKPILRLLGDKRLVKGYAESKGIKTAKTLMAISKPAEGQLDSLAGNSFVLKASHGSGTNVFIRNFKTKSQRVTSGKEHGKPIGVDIRNETALAEELQRWLDTDYGMNLEWVYTGNQRTVLVEELMDIGSVDYKFYCFYGHCQMVQTNTPSQNRTEDVHVDFYTPDWRRLRVRLRQHSPRKIPLPRPSSLTAMRRAAKMLSRNLDFVRVDLYELKDGSVRLGEFSFNSHGCWKEWLPASFGKELATAWKVDYGPCAGKAMQRKTRPLGLEPYLESPSSRIVRP